MIVEKLVTKLLPKKTILYFAVNENGEYIYLKEEKMTCVNPQSRIKDLVEDCNNLQLSLDWEQVKDNKPSDTGCYHAAVKEEDDKLVVISCSPVLLF